MPQFFITVENIQNNLILITDKSDLRHILNVLRLTKGDIIDLTDDEGFQYKARISCINSEYITAEIMEKYKSTNKLAINIILAQSILKGQKQDIVIQKATELGVKTIIPFISKNTVVKFSTEKDQLQKVQRWQKIASEASKQCERNKIPEITPITNINEVMDKNGFDVTFACVERKAECSIKRFLTDNRPETENPNILIILGPEGGWDNEELNLFKNKNISQVSLGNLILRAETAAIAAISDVIYEYEL